MKTMRFRAFMLGLGAVAAALGVAACSGSGDDENATVVNIEKQVAPEIAMPETGERVNTVHTSTDLPAVGVTGTPAETQASEQEEAASANENITDEEKTAE